LATVVDASRPPPGDSELTTPPDRAETLPEVGWSSDYADSLEAACCSEDTAEDFNGPRAEDYVPAPMPEAIDFRPCEDFVLHMLPHQVPSCGLLQEGDLQRKCLEIWDALSVSYDERMLLWSSLYRKIYIARRRLFEGDRTFRPQDEGDPSLGRIVTNCGDINLRADFLLGVMGDFVTPY